MQLSSRVDDFLTDDLFIISKTPYGKYSVRILIDNEIIVLQALFTSTDKALQRIEFCRELGIDGEVVYETESGFLSRDKKLFDSNSNPHSNDTSITR